MPKLYTITTLTETFSGTLEEVCRWQCQRQAKFADIDGVDMDAVHFDPDAVEDTVRRVEAVIRMYDQGLPGLGERVWIPPQEEAVTDSKPETGRITDARCGPELSDHPEAHVQWDTGESEWLAARILFPEGEPKKDRSEIGFRGHVHRRWSQSLRQQMGREERGYRLPDGSYTRLWRDALPILEARRDGAAHSNNRPRFKRVKVELSLPISVAEALNAEPDGPSAAVERYVHMVSFLKDAFKPAEQQQQKAGGRPA